MAITVAAKSGIILGVLLAGAPLLAQTQLSGAKFGYVHDTEARAVRPIVGYPGAAYLAPAVRSEVDDAQVSPDGRYMLLRQGDAAVLEAADAPGTASLTLPAFRQALWSDDAKAFALVLADGLEFRYFERDAAGAWAALSFAPLSGEGKIVLAVDAARKQLWLRQGGTEAALFVATAGDGEAVRLPLDADIAALSLPFKSGETLWLAAGTGKIYQLRLTAGLWQAEVLAETPEVTAARGEFRGLRALTGGNFISVHRQGADFPARLILHSGAGEVLDSVDLEGSPDGLNIIAGTPFFTLQRSLTKGGALEIYDSAERRLYFIPAEAVATQGGEL